MGDIEPVMYFPPVTVKLPFTVSAPQARVLDTEQVPNMLNGPLIPAHAVRAPVKVPPASGSAAAAKSYADLTA